MYKVEKIEDYYRLHFENGNRLYFSIEDGVAMIDGRTADHNWEAKHRYQKGAIEIPAQIEYEGKVYDVKKIKEYSFMNSSEMTSIDIAEGIEEIGTGAFAGCDRLKDVKLPNSLVKLGAKAFTECNELETLSLPDLLNDVPYALCSECKNLKEVTISKCAKRIKTDAFSLCVKLKTVKMPDQLEEIAFGAFSNCVALEELTFPKALRIIHPFAFEECKQIKKMVNQSPNFICTANELIDIQNKLLLWVNPDNITRYSIPEGVEYFPMVFENDKNLEEIVIPEGVKILLKGSFDNCTNLKHVTMPDSLIAIENDVFHNCKNLESITLSKGIVAVASDAFSGCNGLKKIVIEGMWTDYLTMEFVDNIPSLEEIEFTNPDERHFPIMSFKHGKIKETQTNGNHIAMIEDTII